jgi:diacylglycerol kinase (ATP)
MGRGAQQRAAASPESRRQMVEQGGFSFASRVESFRCAFRGVWILLASQHNAWIHLVATLCACGLGLLLGISRLEWCAIAVAIVVVWVAEALNTAFELLCDVASPEFHPLVQKGKDVAAAAVLLSAAGAVVIGLLVFVPHLACITG